jgi:hypothetical protein
MKIKRYLFWTIFFLVMVALLAIAANYAIRNFTGLGPVPVR